MYHISHIVGGKKHNIINEINKTLKISRLFLEHTFVNPLPTTLSRYRKRFSSLFISYLRLTYIFSPPNKIEYLHLYKQHPKHLWHHIDENGVPYVFIRPQARLLAIKITLRGQDAGI